MTGDAHRVICSRLSVATGRLERMYRVVASPMSNSGVKPEWVSSYSLDVTKAGVTAATVTRVKDVVASAFGI
jgi:hypothetical protein